MQFIDSTKFMASSLTNLVNNFYEGIIELNVNMDTMIKNVELVELHMKYATASFNTQILKVI